MMFFFFFFDEEADAETAAIERLIEQPVLLLRQYHHYPTASGQIAHYYALTADALIDLCIAEDEQISRVFARYDRSILERDNYFPGAEPLLNRIFDGGR